MDGFDIKLGISNNPYKRIDAKEVQMYIKEELSKITYPYERDELPDLNQLIKDVETASGKMKDRAKKINLTPNQDVEISLGEELVEVCKVKEPLAKITCSLDSRLLRRILDRKSHWNNAEIGCHIEFKRIPDLYSPDMHTLLQFLHL